MAQIIGVPKELFPGEKRVATVPDVVEKLLKLGFSVVVQAGAGEAATIGDDAYRAAGATVVPDAAGVWSGADIIFKVRAPSPDEVDLMREGQTLVSFLWPAQNPDLLQRLAAKKATVLAMDSVPRMSRAPKTRRAVVHGEHRRLSCRHRSGARIRPLLHGPDHRRRQGAAGQGVRHRCRRRRSRGHRARPPVSAPSSRANDTRPEVGDQIKSLGGEFVPVNYVEEGSGVGGYAKVMSEGFQQAQREVFAKPGQRSRHHHHHPR